ncbi:ATP-binding protein [Peribacillus alkalitolerans]|uniref:ATP-binding protein n=1 Tax=Peribacillus alkalitolerans TaxID=1550385 RepID=UPI0013CFC292|nr:AAA family ATPase [Peribacillus alkalitolerans]
MRIVGIELYGYGKMENIRFALNSDLIVFYGENEAGKSTLMSFIHSILFGFPTKQQIENRYEPKNQSKYGGKLTIQSEQHGQVIVERIRGKAKGDVTVTFPDGRIGQEEVLVELLQGMDKLTFQSIFSFNLDGISALRNMKKDEIGKYLLSAGLVGSDRLLQVQSELQKEMDQRYKPAGKNPPINKAIKELQSLQLLTKKADEAQSEYMILKDEYVQLQRELAETETIIKSLDQELQFLAEWKSIKPIMDEHDEVNKRLEEIGDFPFPIDGKKRLEQLIQARIPLEAQKLTMASRRKEIEDLLKNGLMISPEIEAEIQLSVENATSIHEWTKQESEYLLEIKRLEGTISDRLQDLHLELRPEQIHKIDTSEWVKQQSIELDQASEKMKNEKIQLDQQFQFEKDKLETSEKKIRELTSQLLSKEKRDQLLMVKKEFGQAGQDYLKRVWLSEQIETLEKKIHNAKKQEEQAHKKQNLISLFLATICGGGVFYSLIVNQWVLSVVFLLLLLMSLSATKLIRKTPVSVELMSEKQQLIEQLELLGGLNPIQRNLAEEELIAKDDEIQKRVQEEKIRKQEYEHIFNHIVDRFEKWERESEQLQVMKAKLLQKWGLPAHFGKLKLESIYQTLQIIKLTCRELETLNQKNLTFMTRTSKVKENLLTYAEGLKLPVLTWQDAFFGLKQALTNLQEEKIGRSHINQERLRIDEQVTYLLNEIGLIDQEIMGLYGLAECKEEEQFRHLANLNEEKLHLLQKKAPLQESLRGLSKEFLEWLGRVGQRNIHTANYEIKQTEREKSLDKQHELYAKLTEHRHKISLLEEGGTYEQTIHHFLNQKSSFQASAKEWAKFALAKEMLGQAIASYRNEKLPKIMTTAEQYVNVLTNGEYTKLSWSIEEEQLILQRKDGVWFEATEVSRGTSEQVYMALRFSLAEHTSKEERLPIIIDDSFVNFDDKRTSRAIELLQKVKEKHQILFFTCHQHVANKFNKKHVIHLQTNYEQTLV